MEEALVELCPLVQCVPTALKYLFFAELVSAVCSPDHPNFWTAILRHERLDIVLSEDSKFTLHVHCKSYCD